METIRIMLDTSAYVAFMRGDPKVKRVIQEADEINLNPIVLGELLSGFMKGRKEAWNREILVDFMKSSRVWLREIDEETSERYAAIFCYLREKGTPIPTNDLWIAATAMQFGLRVVTMDKHFRKVPQIIIEFHQ